MIPTRILGSRLQLLSQSRDIPLDTYEEVLNLMICSNFTPGCYLGTCRKCPGVKNLSQVLSDVFEEHDITEISFMNWVLKPRCTMEKITCATPEFVKIFSDQAQSLLKHAFIAKQQSSYLRFVKDNLIEKECVVICDFAENYAFVAQNAVPGFHWNNDQATVYPVMIYYKMNGVLEKKSLIIISDNLHHDSVVVWAFSGLINSFIKSFMPNPAKIFYFSDGAPQQFKNFKNFINIYYHQLDFNVHAEWNFFATAHGKGPCDGIGGTIKRQATKASLQRSPENPILTPLDLYNWAITSGLSSTVEYWDGQNYEAAKNFLSERFLQAKPVPQTLQAHCVIPANDGCVITKKFSFSLDSRTHKIIK